MYKFEILPFDAEHIDMMLFSFANANWSKPRSTFEQYFSEQQDGDRKIWVAFDAMQLAGYVTLCWKSKYLPFLHADIPEIMDLNVLPKFRERNRSRIA